MAKKPITLSEMNSHIQILKRFVLDQLRAPWRFLGASFELAATERESEEEWTLVQKNLKSSLYNQSERNKILSFTKLHPGQSSFRNFKALHRHEIFHYHYDIIFEYFEAFDRTQKRLQALKIYNKAFDFYAMHNDCISLEILPDEIRTIIRNRQNAMAPYYQKELLIDLFIKKDCDQQIKHYFENNKFQIDDFLKEKINNLEKNIRNTDQLNTVTNRKKQLKNLFKQFFDKNLQTVIGEIFLNVVKSKSNEIRLLTMDFITNYDTITYYLERNNINITSPTDYDDIANYKKIDESQYIYCYPSATKMPKASINLIKYIKHTTSRGTVRYNLGQIELYEKILYYITNNVNELPNRLNLESGPSREEYYSLFDSLQNQYLHREDASGKSIYKKLADIYNQRIDYFFKNLIKKTTNEIIS